MKPGRDEKFVSFSYVSFLVRGYRNTQVGSLLFSLDDDRRVTRACSSLFIVEKKKYQLFLPSIVVPLSFSSFLRDETLTVKRNTLCCLVWQCDPCVNDLAQSSTTYFRCLCSTMETKESTCFVELYQPTWFLL